MKSARDRLIVALDVSAVEQARALIEALGNSVGVYKIGLELMFAGGIALATELASRGSRVFLDAKLNDIEATVERATAAIARIGAEFLTVHAVGIGLLTGACCGRIGAAAPSVASVAGSVARPPYFTASRAETWH